MITATVPCLGQTQAGPKTQVQTQPQTQQPRSEYASLRARVKSGDLAADFKRLRIAYVGSPEYQKAKDTDDEKRAMLEALDSRDFHKALQNAEVVLDNNFTDMDAHFVEYIAYRELGEAAKSDFHHSIFRHLVRSILDSGDGKSREGAYVVASVAEEYVVLRVLGLRPVGQSLDQGQGHSYDVLETKDPESGKSVKLYFNVDVPMGQLISILGDKKGKKK